VGREASWGAEGDPAFRPGVGGFAADASSHGQARAGVISW